MVAVPSYEPRPPAHVVAALDGEHVLVASAGTLWLEARRTQSCTALPLATGDAIAITTGRAWSLVDGTLHTHPLARNLTETRLELGDGAALVAGRTSVVASGAGGTYLVRDTGTTVTLAETQVFVRPVSDHRYLLEIEGVSLVVDVTATPRARPLGMLAPILDAAPVLDPATFVLLLDRGRGAQELCVMRASGNVLARIPVRHVARIAGASRGYLVALATHDGRVIVYDLRERRVVSADRVADRAPSIALDPDGTRLLGIADELFERPLIS